MLAPDRGTHLAVGCDVVGGPQRTVEAEVELELARRVLVIAVAHVQAERLPVLDHVQEHRAQLLELVDVVAVGLRDARRHLALARLAQPHHLRLDPDQELVAELLLEVVGDPLEVLARVGVEQLTGLGVVTVAVHTGHAVVPRQHRERVEVGDRRQLRFLGAEADVVAVAVGEEVCGGSVDELVALLGHLWEERGDDALAHHPAGDRHLLEEDVPDPLSLDPPRQLLDLLGATGRTARLLERLRGRLDPGLASTVSTPPPNCVPGEPCLPASLVFPSTAILAPYAALAAPTGQIGTRGFISSATNSRNVAGPALLGYCAIPTGIAWLAMHRHN